MFLLILVLCCTLWSCENPPPPPLTSEAEAQALAEVMAHCYRDYVARLDDGISDARTIAGALGRVCWTTYREEFERYARNLTPGARAMFLKDVRASGPDFALRAVLDYRRQKQQQR